LITSTELAKTEQVDWRSGLLTRVLVFGDTHIPTRRQSIPEVFFDHIKEARYDLALVTGDLVREHDMRAALPPLPRTFIVRGNMDHGLDYNVSEQVQLDEFRILLVHGTQFRPRGNLDEFLAVLHHVGADVGIHGHTHEAAIDLYHEKLFLNPGTISGATGGSSGRAPASFMEFDVKGVGLSVTLHYTDWDLVKVTEAQFKKKGSRIERVQ
jgi:vacuolar protein sorting-associated protein 29